MSLVEAVASIAVFPPNGLGDAMLTLPAIEALELAYPCARITLLGRAVHAALFRGRPGPIAEVYVVGDSFEERLHHIDALRQRRFDLAVQLHGGGAQSNAFIRALQARVSIGAMAHDAPPLDRAIPYARHQQEVMRQLEIVALVGASPTIFDPRLAVTANDRAQLTEYVDVREPYIVLHPGATDKRRRWDPRRYARLARQLSARGYQIYVTGDSTERADTRAVSDLSDVEDLGGKLTIGALVALLARAELVVGNDTGALHLARAAGASTVTLYWLGNLINFAPLARARHRSLVSWRVHCPICRSEQVRVRCPHDVSFVDDISYAEVETATLDALADSPNVSAKTPSHAARNRCSG